MKMKVKNRKITTILLTFSLLSTVSCSRNLNPLTMTLKDYKDVDFRNLVDGKVKFRKPNDITNVEIKNNRDALDNEIKIPVYIYDNDRFSEAKYQYFIKGEDYRGYPYSTNYVNSQRESDSDFSGVGSGPYFIGFYEDSKFEKLIDPNKFISVDESIKEIHVRRAQEHYVPNQMYTGTYKSENLNVVADGRNFDIYFDNIHYKIIGKGTGGEFHIKEMYINNELVEDLENYGIMPNVYSYTVYHGICFSFWGNGVNIIPVSNVAISEIAYSAISHL